MVTDTTKQLFNKEDIRTMRKDIRNLKDLNILKKRGNMATTSWVSRIYKLFYKEPKQKAVAIKPNPTDLFSKPIDKTNVPIAKNNPTATPWINRYIKITNQPEAPKNIDISKKIWQNNIGTFSNLEITNSLTENRAINQKDEFPPALKEKLKDNLAVPVKPEKIEEEKRKKFMEDVEQWINK
jgi:hypothetical protein